MNPWEIIGTALGWFLLVLLVLVVLIVLAGVVVAVINGMRQWFKPKPQGLRAVDRPKPVRHRRNK